MRLTRVHVEAPLEAGRTTQLEGDAANHITRVLRLRVGDGVTLFDGRGGEYSGRVAGMRRGGVIVEVGEHAAVERESPLDLTLLQGIARGERMDLVVQKSTELGVTRIVPVVTERTVVRLDTEQAARKLTHWRAVAAAACEQCGRNRLPEIDSPQPFAAALQPQSRSRLTLDPDAAVPLGAPLAAADSVAVLVGPEGGLTDLEREIAQRAGFEPRHMGPRILRAETAALTAVAALQVIAGDLAGMKGRT